MDRALFPMVLGMIQPEPCPGSYRNMGMDFWKVMELAKREVKILDENGFDGYIIQNRNDAPVRQKAEPQSIAYMSVLANELKREFPHLIQGIMINWDGIASLAVADAAGSDFVRIEHTYTGAEIGYAGFMEAQCVEVCEFRKKLGTKIPVYADVQEVHYEQVGGKKIPDAAWDTIYNAFADGLFIGGHSTQESIELVQAVRKRLGNDIPIFLSSGSTADNIAEILNYYDGVSVGTWVKNGNMKNPIDPDRAKMFMDEVRKVRCI